MRLSLPCRITALGAILIIATLTPSFAQDSALISNNNYVNINTDTPYTLAKRAGEDEHDHDHEHPPAPTTAVPGVTSSAAVTLPTPTTTVPAPGHDHDHDHEHEHDHDHDHDHGHEEGHEGHEHEQAEAEAGHSHGPARTCDAHNHDHGEYVVWHHIVALFVLLVIAALGCVLPMMIRDSPRTRFAVQLGKYFGAGVVLSVAFVHILPEALFALTHPCLSKAWTDDYPGYAPLIMMFSGLTMLVIEYLASTVAVNVEAQNKKAAAAAISGSAEEAHEHGHAHAHAKHDHDHSHEDSDSAEFQDQKTGAGAAPY
ncbi:hypothetical protein BGX24_010742, partial [Mortierella sp. AD032]